MSLYDRFRESGEEGFRQEFIKPLLVRMGFIGITDKHGSQEFGKDFVFSELDRFGNLRHMAVQAKHEKTINHGGKVDVLISQIRQAFTVPYTLASAPAERRSVAAVYVFNTGTITENAVTLIHHSLARERAANTFVFGGDQLELFANGVAQRQDQDARVRLTALLNEVNWNVKLWKMVLETLETDIQEKRLAKWRATGPLVSALEQFLAQPVLPERIDPMRI